MQLQGELSGQIGRLKKLNRTLFKSLQPMTQSTHDLAITLLLDNSGSLRGNPVKHMAAWAALLSEWLEAAAIRHEILGFTTRSWKGGQSRQKWLRDGKPLKPGRLCDLRHIIYKSFDEPASNVVANCAVMMREGLLKENVDGEALLWANARLEAHEAARKMLFVVSDGAPVDDSTLDVNPGNFLEKHLYAAASWIEQARHVELIAIGIGMESRYYAASTKADLGDLGVPILKHIFSNPT
nr:hypothetical protein [Bradyrhizobium sp. CCGB01]